MLPACSRINADCVHDPHCPAMNQGLACWSVAGAACCRRDDKLRCLQCSIYLAHIAGASEPVPMETVHQADRYQVGQRNGRPDEEGDEPCERSVTIEPVEWPK